MNNSEVSVLASSADALAAPQTYGYPSSWDNPASSSLEANQASHDGDYSDGGVAIVQCLEATADCDIRGAGEVEIQPSLEGESPDLGLWLFSNSAARHDQWERLRGIPQYVTRASQFSRYWPELVKRSSDIAGSLLLLCLLLPLLLLISVLIRLDSSGPIVFRHYRVGKGGRHFVLWKFRSMKMDVPRYEASPQSASDVRLTRVGRWMRRLSIDELPQLINVLKGEMSLVGPRPEMPFIVARYGAVERERLVVRPGITGLWQISPARAFPIHENLQYDLHYIRNQNLLLDCAIILRTVTAVIHGVGAV